ncbi:hypothetical protein ACHWQZ_G004729 [Mnemiopsis leidyi]
MTNSNTTRRPTNPPTELSAVEREKAIVGGSDESSGPPGRHEKLIKHGNLSVVSSGLSPHSLSFPLYLSNRVSRGP